MDNKINESIEEITEYFNQAIRYSNFYFFATDPKPDIFLKALNNGLAPNHYFKITKSESSLIEVSLITAFFMSASLKQIQKEEKLFLDNIETPAFQGLLFTADMGTFELKLSEKIKYLLSLGYNPNVIATPEMNINTILKSNINITPLHYVKNKKVLQCLLDSNANLDIKANILTHFHLISATEKGIKKFNTSHELENYFKELCSKNILLKKNYDYLMGDINYMLTLYNQELKNFYEALTPIELAKKNKEKGKWTLLEKYNKTQTPTEKYEEIKTLWSNKKKKEALNLFLVEMKNDNQIVFDNLLEFKDLILTTKNKNNMVNQMILTQQTKWLDKVFDNQITDDTFRGHSDTSYLVYAASKRKTQAFIYLYKKGINSGLENFIEKTKNEVERLQHYDEDLNYNLFFPVLIVDFLITQGYTFNTNNQYILDKIINFEKEKLEQLMQEESTVKLEKKKVKI